MKQIKQKPMFQYLMVLTIASAAGLQSWRTLFNNFAVETVKLDGLHISMIQSIREIPGFLALCVIFLLVFIKEQRISALSVICMGIGIVLTGFMPTFNGLIITTLLMSFGFHYYETTNQSLILQNFDEYQSPLVMGSQRSMMSLVSIIVGICVFLMAYGLSFKTMFSIIGMIIISTGIWGLFSGPKQNKEQVQHKKMVLRKKYSLFYYLTFLSGARRQIFMVFSILLLVKKFDFSVQQITMLFVLNNIINYFAAPLIAKAIKKFGERTILSCEYGSLIFIFTAYAFCPYKWMVATFYVLDHISFNGSMAIRTYFQKIANKQDISSSTAVSFTINHIAAVILPVVGGYLWMINYRIPFLFGTFMGLLSLIVVQFMPRAKARKRSALNL